MSDTKSSSCFGIALFGIGRIGTVHFGNLVRNSRAAVYYVIDEDTPRAHAAVNGYRLQDTTTVLHPSDQERALADDRVQGVVVCTPTFTHDTIVTNALKHGKAVFCEKPLSQSFEGMKRCYEAAEKANRPLLCAFNRRMDPSLSSLRGRILAGEIGKVHMVKSCSRDHPMNSIAYLKTSGGIFHDSAVHDIDIVCWLVGEFPVSVYVQGHAHNEEVAAIPDVDTVVIVLKFPSGAIGIIDMSREAVFGHDQRVEAFGSGGMLLSKNQQPTSVDVYNRQGVTGPCVKASCIDRYMDSYARIMEHFLDTLAGEKLQFEKTQVLNVSTIANACAESLKTGLPVKTMFDHVDNS